MKQEQIEIWRDNPVTKALLSLVASQLDGIRAAKGMAYQPYQPERTQEILANLNGAEDTWEHVLDLLDGDWSAFDDEEADESERDTSTTG